LHRPITGTLVNDCGAFITLFFFGQGLVEIKGEKWNISVADKTPFGRLYCLFPAPPVANMDAV
jgi:hypothetical protein